MNVVLISHCDFDGNSAYHVLAVARELQRREFSPVICIPLSKQTLAYVEPPTFPVLTYDEAQTGGLTFPDGRGPDIVHAFTPREHVRSVTENLSTTYSCPYVVHLEDNEAAILSDDLAAQSPGASAAVPPALLDTLPLAPWRTHPLRSARFLAGASGVTAVIDTLLEFKPDHLPGAVFWPGFDPAVIESKPSAALRDELGLGASDVVMAYTGNVHNSNLSELRSLYIALGLLRRAGAPVKLLRTGSDHVDMSWVADCGIDGVLLDQGFVSRERLWELLALADVLVQPGGPNRFNDYRFPSKLPDFLASAKPVVLPATNLGRYLADGDEALLLRRGNAMEIAEAVSRVIADPDLQRRLGTGGRAFALQNLSWEKNVESIIDLYSTVCEGRAPTTQVAVTQMPQATEVVEPPAKLVAFYLPQFHTIPENDEWWGEGFTEWSNVDKAVPQFKGHHQPQLPGILGYYDLADPATLEKQAVLARSYGIYGFCYYYYWFDGRRVLERPVEQMLERESPDMPFCLCWANENWTRRWDGLEQDVLLRQAYSRGWEDRLVRDLAPALSDRRYIRANGSPLLLIYRVNLIPNVERAMERLRTAAQDAGFELHLAAVQSFGITDPRLYGLDAAVEFPPHTSRFLLEHDRIPGVSPEFKGYFEDYQAVMRHQLALELPEYAWYRGVMPSWDNTARRGADAHILVNSSPALYQTWLRKLVLQTLCRSTVDEPFVFINAWNEWAEGTHLEPDQKFGNALLEATSSGLRDGLRQYYASLGFDLDAARASNYLRQILDY